MTPKFKTRILTIVVLIFIYSCNGYKPGSFDYNDNDRQLVEQTIHTSIGWAKNKDIKLLYSIINNDSSFLEVHPGPKVVKGFSDFRNAEEFWMSPDFKAIRYNIRDLQISFSKSGNVAWWFCILDDINEWKGEPATWEKTRWTGIMEKQDGRWIIMQQHFSFASE